MRNNGRLASEVIAHKYLTLDIGQVATQRLGHNALNLHGVARHNLVAETHIVYAKEVGRVALWVLDLAQYIQCAALCHSLYDKHSRHNRLVREVALEEWLVDCYLLDAGNRGVVHVVDSIHQQEWKTVWQHTLNIDDVEQWSLLAIVLKTRLYTLTTNRVANLLHKLGICVVARACCHNATLDAHSEQCEVAEQVEQLVASHLWS